MKCFTNLVNNLSKDELEYIDLKKDRQDFKTNDNLENNLGSKPVLYMFSSI